MESNPLAGRNVWSVSSTKILPYNMPGSNCTSKKAGEPFFVNKQMKWLPVKELKLNIVDFFQYVTTLPGYNESKAK